MNKWEIAQYGVRLAECITMTHGIRVAQSDPSLLVFAYGMHDTMEPPVEFTHDEITRGTQPQDEYHIAMARNNANYKDNRN